jgi:hypothetical protein
VKRFGCGGGFESPTFGYDVSVIGNVLNLRARGGSSTPKHGWNN